MITMMIGLAVLAAVVILGAVNLAVRDADRGEDE